VLESKQESQCEPWKTGRCRALTVLGKRGRNERGSLPGGGSKIERLDNIFT
jgi:hypothetical protein